LVYHRVRPSAASLADPCCQCHILLLDSLREISAAFAAFGWVAVEIAETAGSPTVRAMAEEGNLKIGDGRCRNLAASQSLASACSAYLEFGERTDWEMVVGVEETCSAALAAMCPEIVGEAVEESGSLQVRGGGNDC